MPWVPAPFSGGVVWSDRPSVATALDAANLNREENAEAAYAVAIGQSIVDYLETGASAAAVTAGGSDAVGRTQILGTSTVKAPALRQLVSVTDAPWNAKGDARRVTDGAITSGTNQVSSATVAFTSANVGQVLEFVGAGPTAVTQPNICGYIGAVVAGVASLFTTPSFSTPLNASTTVASGGTVTFGTDDSAAVQAAANALSTAGGGKLHFTAPKAYWFNQHIPASDVTYEGNGATFYVMPIPNSAIPRPMFYVFPGILGTAGKTNVTWRGFNFVGHNAEYSSQFPLMAVAAVNFRVYDCRFTSFVPDALYLVDITGVRVVGCDFTNCCTGPAGGPYGNPLNLGTGANGATYPLTDLYVAGNHVKGQFSEGIDIFSNQGSSGTSTTPFSARIVGNSVVNGNGAAAGAAITMEIGGTGAPTMTCEQASIANNVCTNGTIALAVNASVPTTNPALIARIAIAGNIVDTSSATNPGIDYRGSFATITGNRIKAANGIQVQPPGGTTGSAAVACTGTTNNTTSVTGVTSDGSVTNGTQIAGPGIPVGTFIVSGAGGSGGAGTWTISQAATNAATETISAHLMATDVNIVGNGIRGLSSAATQSNAINLQYVRESALAANVITFDRPNTSNQYGIWIINCGWLRLRGNDVSWAPKDGIRVTNSNDIKIRGGEVYNCSIAGAGANGIRLATVTGTINVVANAEVIDDRSPHLMFNAIENGGTCTNLYIRDNTLFGSTSALIDSLVGVVEVRGNSGYNPVGTVTPAVPATSVAVASQPYDRTFYVTAGASACTMAIQNGPSPVIPSGAFGTIRVPAGKTVTPTYTAAPTWVVEGE